MQLQRQIDRLLAQRASEWHQILERADESERAAFVAWLKQSPLHVKEYLEAVYTDQVLKHVDPDRQEDIDALLAQVDPQVMPFTNASAEPVTRRPRLLGWRGAVAAGLALCVCAAALIYPRFHAQAFSTDIGEQRTIELQDASIVTLNADSRMRVRLDTAERDIELVQGEALFQVAHDAKRPFRVQTKTAVVEAVGTQFNVYERTDGTRVSVLEGRIRLATSRETLSLKAGEEAQARLDGSIERNARAEVQNAIAWRERRLVFVNTPLEEMVHEFNRYSRAVRLRLDGVTAGTHHYNGIFDASDPESLAELLRREPDLVVERQKGEIIIRQR